MKARPTKASSWFQHWAFLAALGAGFFAVAIAVAVLFGMGKTRTVFVEPLDPTSGTPKSAPDFEVVMYRGSEVTGAENLKFSSLFRTGTPVVLNFWAGLCPPCRREMPDLQEVHDKFKGQVLLLGLDVGPFVGLGSREDGQALLKELQVTYPVGTTFDAGAVKKYKVLGMPSTFFIKPNGEILQQWTGLLTKQKLEELVQNLLAASGKAKQ